MAWRFAAAGEGPGMRLASCARPPAHNASISVCSSGVRSGVAAGGMSADTQHFSSCAGGGGGGVRGGVGLWCAHEGGAATATERHLRSTLAERDGCPRNALWKNTRPKGRAGFGCHMKGARLKMEKGGAGGRGVEKRARRARGRGKSVIWKHRARVGAWRTVPSSSHSVTWPRRGCWGKVRTRQDGRCGGARVSTSKHTGGVLLK